MDLYLIRKTPDTVTTTKGPCEFRREWIYPIGNVSMFNVTFPAPRNPLAMLEHLYKQWWIEPSSVRQGHGEHKCHKKS
jgi:hypothetical protein